MSAWRQGGLVAWREVRERARSRGFQAGLAIMLLVVVAAITLSATLDEGPVTQDVAVTGTIPEQLPDAMRDQGDAVDVRVRVHRYDEVAEGEAAVREGDADVLVVDAERLEWRGDTDERLRAVVSGAIQLVAVQERAAAAGIAPDDLAAVLSPVPIDNVELGLVAGRGPDDELVTYITSVVLLTALAVYGNMVLTGVAEEKASRVVEVLLARMPARTLLAGKVAGIGLLGFAQFAVTALAAVVATMVVDSVDLPAARGAVLAWVVVWFVLGYALYAMAFGALGSLASRTQEADSVAAPVVSVLVGGYFASYAAIASDPDSGWSWLVSFLPPTAPFAMPARIALGAAAGWEPVAAAALALLAIAGLVVLAGRVYTGAILHTGRALGWRDAWRRAIAPRRPGTTQPAPDPFPGRSGGKPTVGTDPQR
jgi:ABC-2 type transport system permease protein